MDHTIFVMPRVNGCERYRLYELSPIYFDAGVVNLSQISGIKNTTAKKNISDGSPNAKILSELLGLIVKYTIPAVWTPRRK